MRTRPGRRGPARSRGFRSRWPAVIWQDRGVQDSSVAIVQVGVGLGLGVPAARCRLGAGERAVAVDLGDQARRRVRGCFRRRFRSWSRRARWALGDAVARSHGAAPGNDRRDRVGLASSASSPALSSPPSLMFVPASDSHGVVRVIAHQHSKVRLPAHCLKALAPVPPPEPGSLNPHRTETT